MNVGTTSAFAFLARALQRGVLRRAALYLASGSASALISFFLLPVLTKYLSPADYGVVEIFTTLSTCLTGILLVGGNTILAKEYFDGDEATRAGLMGQLLGLLALTTAATTAGLTALVLAGCPLADWLSVGPAVLFGSVAFSAATAVVTLYTTLLQVEKRAALYACYVNSKTLIEIGLTLVLIIGVGLQWQGRFGGMLVGALAYAGFALMVFLRRGVRLSFARPELRRLVTLGVPLVAAHVSVWAYSMVDRVMMSHQFDLATTGLYSVGFRFASVVSMAESAFSLAWMPFFFENIRRCDPRTDARVLRLSVAYIGGLFAFALGFAGAAQWLLPAMVNDRFDEARQFILVLCLAFCSCGAWKMFNGYLIAAGRTRLYGAITSATAILHVALTWWLLRRLGPMGAAWATLVTYVTATGLTIWATHRIRRLPWRRAWRSASTP